MQRLSAALPKTEIHQYHNSESHALKVERILEPSEIDRPWILIFRADASP
jgi:hypothetical protein